MRLARPEVIGPYRIVDTLGQGGMGVVYRAIDSRSDREVALKTVHIPHEGHLNSLRREIRVLAALDHPGIVTIYDHGAAAGMPWYAMELVPGPTLRVFRDRLAGVEREDGAAEPVTDWWTTTLESLIPSPRPIPSEPHPVAAERRSCGEGLTPEARHRVLRVLLRLCETLAVLHAAGLVYGDLKPENVLMRSSDRPVLVDFGLTAQFVAPDGREPLEARTCSGGSFAYMAPEQIRGELFDARADLYALGCLLFEMISGQPVCAGNNPHELLLAQMALDPPRLSSLVEDVPAPLEALVDRLLAKEPRFRLGHAGAIADTLAGIIDEPLLLDELPQPPLYRPALAGRGRAMRRLSERARELRAGKGGLVIICGDRGSGKTRLIAELASRGRAQGQLVLSGVCSASPRSALDAFRPLLTAVADRCRHGGPLVTQALLGDRGAVLAAHFESLADLSGASGPADALGSECLEEDDTGVFTYIHKALVVLAEAEGSLTFLLDDLHRAGPATLDLLQFLAVHGELESRPVLIVATCLAEGTEPCLAGEIAGQPEILELRCLDKDDTADMVADMLGLGRAPAELTSRLHQISGGNPFFVAEYLRAAVQDGLLTGDPQGAWRFRRNR